jgi:hypothetical protein
MKPEEIKNFRDAQPFVPFRLCLSDGKTYDIPHPEFLMVTKTILCVGLSDEIPTNLPDAGTWVSPIHVVRVEMLQAA